MVLVLVHRARSPSDSPARARTAQMDGNDGEEGGGELQCVICMQHLPADAIAAHFEGCFDSMLPVEPTLPVHRQSSTGEPTGTLFGALPHLSGVEAENILAHLSPSDISRVSCVSKVWCSLNELTRCALRDWHAAELGKLELRRVGQGARCSCPTLRPLALDAPRRACIEAAMSFELSRSIRKVVVIITLLTGKSNVSFELASEDDRGVLCAATVGDLIMVVAQNGCAGPRECFRLLTPAGHPLRHYDEPLIAHIHGAELSRVHARGPECWSVRFLVGIDNLKQRRCVVQSQRVFDRSRPYAYAEGGYYAEGGFIRRVSAFGFTVTEREGWRRR